MIVYVIVKYLANAGSCGLVDERIASPASSPSCMSIVQSLSAPYRMRF